jgi:SAM-dependent methyltransferase
MELLSVGVYEAPGRHGAISNLIRRHSTNPLDVRDAALEGIEVASARRLLDLGCGFGFMAEGLARRAKPGTEIVGIDINPANGEPFEARMAVFDCRGHFDARALDSELPFGPRSFDGAVSSYALYFFPGIIPDVARVLRPEGFFVSVTHHERSLQSLLDVLGLPGANSPQVTLLRAFSAETGAAGLCDHFETMERREYSNSLVFLADEIDDLLRYVRFKLPLLRRERPMGADLPPEIAGRLRRMLESEGSIEIRKDDTIFVCTGPRSP